MEAGGHCLGLWPCVSQSIWQLQHLGWQQRPSGTRPRARLEPPIQRGVAFCAVVKRCLARAGTLSGPLQWDEGQVCCADLSWGSSGGPGPCSRTRRCRGQKDRVGVEEPAQWRRPAEGCEHPLPSRAAQPLPGAGSVPAATAHRGYQAQVQQLPGGAGPWICASPLRLGACPCAT